MQNTINVVELNSVNYGSTGNITINIKKKSLNSGINVVCYFGLSKKDIKDNNIIGWKTYNKLCVKLAHLTGLLGTFSVLSTRKFLNKCKKNNINIIHLHNIHLSFVNIPMLFKFVKKNDIPLIWTFHDCWPLTGHCPYFDLAKCEKWKIGCYNCLNYKEYPQSLIDNSKFMWKLKKQWFTGINNMTIVTPSQWLANIVKESYLKDYPVRVINNGIDLNVFKPTVSDFRKKYNISDNKYILLGVAFGWGVRKGLDVFVELSKRLDSGRYQIVLVGTDDNVDKKLPSNIISIHRTNNQQELAELYSAADLFVNPTREENYPTVNMESIACGTPILTFRTGGSPEILDEKTGSVVDCDDIDAMEQEIIRICTTKPYKKEDCIEHAKSFDMNDRFQEYVDLYKEIDGQN